MRDTLSHNNELRNDLAIGVVLLAAGSASRIGYRPKCLLELDGEPLIQRLLHAILNSGIKDIVIVLGHYAEDIKSIITNFAATLVHNPTPDAGQNSSLHCGLNALSRQLDAVMVVLADQPLLDASAIGDLMRAFQERPRTTHVMVPTVDHLPGNPVVFSSDVSAAILARDTAFGCKQWQLENPGGVYRWQTTNESYRIDIDTSEDIDALAISSGHHLHWPSSYSS